MSDSESGPYVRIPSQTEAFDWRAARTWAVFFITALGFGIFLGADTVAVRLLLIDPIGFPIWFGWFLIFFVYLLATKGFLSRFLHAVAARRQVEIADRNEDDFLRIHNLGASLALGLVWMALFVLPIMSLRGLALGRDGFNDSFFIVMAVAFQAMTAPVVSKIFALYARPAHHD